MNLCKPWPQGSRSGGVAEVAYRVCTWRSVHETAATAINISENTNPKRSGEEPGGVVLQEKDLSVVAAERPQGTASTERSLVARRQ